MTQQYKGRPPDPQQVVAEMLKNLGFGGGNSGGKRSKSSDPGRSLGPVVLILALITLAFFSFYQVEPGEIGVVRTFGKESRRAEPGPHFLIPFAEQVDTVNLEEVRRIEVGFRGDQPRPQESKMLTGDENIVEAHMVVQYRVVDPSLYLFHLADPEGTLLATAEVALRSTIGRTAIDDALTKGRSQVQADTRTQLQALMDRYKSGLSITEVKLQSVDPPQEVQQAFHDVVRAREEKEKLINQAQAYKADVLPRAKGEAAKQIQQATAYKEQRVLRAQGDASKFDQVYSQYEKAKDVTRRRLYLETMQRVMARIQSKTIVDAGVQGNLLPVLQLGAVSTAAGVTSRQAAPAQAAAPAGGQK